MRYRLTHSPRQRHAQVLTPPNLASVLVNSVSGFESSWLELGSGTGRIADACLTKKRPSHYLGVELDACLLRQTQLRPGATFLQGNVLDPCALDRMLGAELFDRVTGNPPYGMAALPDPAKARLASLCPGLAQVKDWVQLDLYFVLESLARLRRPGEAAFIVGAPIAEDARLTAFRRALTEAASEIECYELPPGIFERKAEVQSYLLVAKFGTSKTCRVTLGRLAGSDLMVSDVRLISADAAALRMDIAFHEFAELDSALRTKRGSRTLQELGASIVRGSRTRFQFDELGVEHFHTSDFPRDGLEVRFTNGHDHGFQTASGGDILLPRVGTRCLDRQAIVAKGRRHYTESVYRLRVPASSRDLVINWITSVTGGNWRRAAAKGSCAKHVTVATLMSMPVPLVRTRS